MFEGNHVASAASLHSNTKLTEENCTCIYIYCITANFYIYIRRLDDINVQACECDSY